MLNFSTLFQARILLFYSIFAHIPNICRGRCGCGRMIIWFTTTCAISTLYHHLSCEFELHLWSGVLDTAALCLKVCYWLATRSVVFSSFLHHKTDCHDIAEILLKVALNTINQIKGFSSMFHKITCWIKSIFVKFRIYTYALSAYLLFYRFQARSFILQDSCICVFCDAMNKALIK